MDKQEKKDVETDINVISERPLKPDQCMNCGHQKLSISTHVFHDIQDLGSPHVKRITRHEQVRWYCPKCREEFRVMEPSIPLRSTYTDEVVFYAISRVLENGDSARRVAKDLNKLHNVKVDHSTISKWIKDKEKVGVKGGAVGVEEYEKINVDVISCDGTFKAVSSKKNDPGWSKKGPSLLHVTRLKNGKLVAILPLGKKKRK